MNTTIDAAGRIVIPKEIRRLTRLVPGAPLEIRARDGVIEIEPAPAKVRMVEKGGFAVAVPIGVRTKLTQKTVNETVESIRSRQRTAAD